MQMRHNSGIVVIKKGSIPIKRPVLKNFLKSVISACVLVTLCLYCISDKLQLTKLFSSLNLRLCKVSLTNRNY